MRNAVITVVSGRHGHLARQRRTLASSHRPVDHHIVVSLGDPDVAELLAAEPVGAHPPATLVELDADPGRLPLSAGRNAGAAAALEVGAELLVFLDVDCLAAPDLLDGYLGAARRRPDALLCGPVTYLSAEQTSTLDDDELGDQRAPHPARPDPPAGDLLDGRHELFWSLSFAATAAVWADIGGFDELFAGYGAEDTDFASQARELGIGLVWVGGADAFHQWHPSANPPVQHVDDVIRNGARYARRWGWWPMTGWLERFAELGLVEAKDDGWVRARPLRVASVPPRHPYVNAVQASGARAVDTLRVHEWEPDPLLDVDYLRTVIAGLDLVHVHFGYEHLQPAQLSLWLDVLAEHHVPLVVTVHDLHNPHLADNTMHRRHLGLLLVAAAEVITLTPGAAAEILRSYARVASVIAHPTVLDQPPGAHIAADGPPVVLVPLGTLRANTADLGPLLGAAADAVEIAGAVLRVDVRPGALADPRAAPVIALAEADRLVLVVSPRRDDAWLAAYVAEAHALLLPYRFGTHSGWPEIARDLGVHAIVPSCGYYSEQWDAAEVYTHDEGRGFDASSLEAACLRALGRPRPPRAETSERRAERAQVRAAHEVVYRRAVS